MKGESTIPLIYGRVIIAAASRNSTDSRRLTEDTSIHLKQAEQWEAGITLMDYRRLLRSAVAISARPTILLDAGAGMPLSAHGPLGNAIGCSPNRMKALELLARFITLRGFFCDVRLEREDRETRFYINLSEDLGSERESALDFLLAAMLNSILFRQLMPVADISVQLQRPAPVDQAHYNDVLSASIEYGKPDNCITFDTANLELPLPGYEPEQFELSVRKCQRLLVEDLKLVSRRDAVERVCERSPGMLWNLDQVAHALHTSGRTLQRQLKKEGTSFQAVLDNWLKQLALNYMQREKLSVEATSTLLGYTDEANFRRAFKRWHGCSPRQFREKTAGL